MHQCSASMKFAEIPAMKVLQLLLIALALTTLATAKIIEENPQQLVQTESTTLVESKDKEEVAESVAEDPKPDSPCFCVDVDLMCLNKTNPTKPSCECEEHPDIPTAIVCCNATDIIKSLLCVNTNMSIYSAIHVINARQPEINLKNFNTVKHIDSLTISDGNISRVVGEFSRFSTIKCLNFSNNNISEISERGLTNLKHLDILDLSTNNLTKLPYSPNQAKVNIRGNVKIACNSVSTAIERGVSFLYKLESMCEVPTNYNWFSSTATVSIQDLDDINQLEKDCPQKCICEPEGMRYLNLGQEDRIGVIMKVDCSNLSLTKFPEKLPKNTLTLNISNNSITSLSTLADNEDYHSIQSLFADENLITSIEDLEGSKFLENFTKLSLKNNKIKSIPYYILSNLEKNLNGKLVYLGGNRFQCECQTIKSQRILSLTQDYDKILCDNMQVRVMELSESLLCKSGHHDWASYIDYVIVIEVILLVALISKVSYDWYVFKNSGFLPLPASWIILYNQKK